MGEGWCQGHLSANLPDDAPFGLTSEAWVAVGLEKQGQWVFPGRWFSIWDRLENTEMERGEECDQPVWGADWSQYVESVQFSHSVVSDSLQPHGLQHTRLPCSSPTPRAYSNSCPLSRGCHPTISSSVIPFSSCLQSFPALESFKMSQFFAWGDQGIGASVSASVLPMNIQGWFCLGWTGLISLQSKGLSRVFSNTAVQKHQFFGTQLTSQSNSHIHAWPPEKP